MSDPRRATEWETALRDGLRRLLPPPTVSSGFDDAVLAALARPLPWWQRLGREARPLIAGMACSLVVMFAAIHWTVQNPTTGLPSRPAALHHAMRPLDMASLDRLLDRPGLSAITLARLTTTEAKPPLPQSEPRLPAQPKRRVSRLAVTILV